MRRHYFKIIFLHIPGLEFHQNMDEVCYHCVESPILRPNSLDLLEIFSYTFATIIFHVNIFQLKTQI